MPLIDETWYERRIAQRAQALDEGLELLGWTFDPLDAGAAHVSIARLGAVVERYLADERLLVAEWWIRRPHVERRLAPRGVLTLRAHSAAEAPVVTRSSDVPPESGGCPHERFWVEIPLDPAPDSLDEWRSHLARVFTAAFARRYRAVDFVVDRPRATGRYLMAIQV